MDKQSQQMSDVPERAAEPDMWNRDMMELMRYEEEVKLAGSASNFVKQLLEAGLSTYINAIETQIQEAAQKMIETDQEMKIPPKVSHPSQERLPAEEVVVPPPPVQTFPRHSTQRGASSTLPQAPSPQKETLTPAGPATCFKCGSALVAGARFCPTCGIAVQMKEAPATTTHPILECPQCGAVDQIGAKFCRGCGAKIGRESARVIPNMCPSCNQPLKPGAKFCPKCGSSVGQVASPPPQEVEPEYTVYAEIATKEPEKLLSESVSCPTCHQPLKPGAKFCPKCGTSVSQAAPAAQACPQCGKPIKGGARFCKSCGFKLN